MKPLKILRSQSQERRAATSISGVTQPASGAGWARREDARSAKFLVQCKGTTSTKAKQITITVGALDQLEHHAGLEGRFPMMHLEIGTRIFWLVPDWVGHEVINFD